MGSKFQDHYKTLQIGQKSTQSQIKSAYYKHIKIWHPDKNPGNKHAVQMSKMINEAKRVLSDPALRREYDRTYINKQNEQYREQGKQSHHSQKNTKSNYNHDQNNRQGTTKDDKSNGRHYQNDSSKSSYNRNYEKNHQNQDNQRDKQREHKEYQHDRNWNNHQQGNRDNKNWNSHQNGYRNQSSHQDDRNWNYYGHQQENRDHTNRNSYHNGSQYQNADQDYTNLYETLGITKGATTKNIENAFRKLAAKYGSSDNPQVKQQFQKILGAYLVLTDPVLRANYDRQYNNSESRNSFTFRFLNETFESFCNSINWDNVLCVFVGCGYVLFVILKYAGILIFTVGKCVLRTLPPLLFILGKLICMIVPPLVKGLIYLVTGLTKCTIWSLKMLCKCIF
ncbi:GATA zinc finger domain-containing protein 14-like [Drosophila mojavensis]|uniref:GATA zinc finger domain-containing protein 14-like n=1 Tax=Drosophila mojavensis TaxID=7230 RepID=UPI0013EE5922|nr:GATA zinc finger domain-containing protein 14-like [Drosophila mojavensis]